MHVPARGGKILSGIICGPWVAAPLEIEMGGAWTVDLCRFPEHPCHCRSLSMPFRAKLRIWVQAL